MTPQKPFVPFPVIEALVHGLRFSYAHARLFFILSFLPFVVTLATLVAMRLLGSHLTLFNLPIILFPSSFVMGLQAALILRFIVLHEYPLLPDSPEKVLRNRAVTQGAIAFAIVSFFKISAHLGLLKTHAFLTLQPEVAAPYAPLALAGLVLVIWAARYLWLYVPLALDWQVKGFFERIGRWAGSVRVFALFALCSLIPDFVAGFLRVAIQAVAGTPVTGFAAAFDDTVVAAALLVSSVMFTAATAAAVKLMAGNKLKDMQA